MGDEIMFASILPDLIRDAKSVAYEVDPRLMCLFENSYPNVKFVAKGSDYSSPHTFDIVVQSGSLAYAYRSDRELFSGVPYLTAEPIRSSRWKELLVKNAGSRKTIGLSWRGGTDATRRNERSIELERLSPLIQQSDCYFVSLQYGNVSEEISRFNENGGNPVHCLLDDFNNFDDFAGLISALDLVVSVQNTTIHMCGALGKSCWA